MTLSTEDLDRISGAQVVDTNGDQVGKAGEVYVDNKTKVPAWLTVSMGMAGASGANVTFLPLAGVSAQGKMVHVPWDTAKVRGAPRIDPSQELSEEQEQQLRSYYGVE